MTRYEYSQTGRCVHCGAGQPLFHCRECSDLTCIDCDCECFEEGPPPHYAHDAGCNTIHEAGPEPCPPPRRD